MLIGVKDSQSDLEKHYKTFCGLYTIFCAYRIHSCSILIKCLLIAIQTALKMNNKIAVILALADVKYSLNDLEKHYKTFCGLYMALKKRP